VLLVAFNRPKETERVIQRLREVKPLKVYFAVDGPREERPGESALVAQTQKLSQQFDWNCQVYTLFQENNLGCGLGVSTAISWALENEDSVIVLEDDILPDPSFFPFCEELLERFKDDDRVFAVSGSSYVPKEFVPADISYRFSPTTQVWGWAIWKRSWEKYEFDIENWRNEMSFSELRRRLGGSWLAAVLWSKFFDLVGQKRIDTWDYQLALVSLKSNSFVATSNVNLTENCGFGDGATHTQTTPRYIQPTDEVTLPLKHTEEKLDLTANKWTQRHAHGATIGNGFRLLTKYILLRMNQYRTN